MKGGQNFLLAHIESTVGYCIGCLLVDPFITFLPVVGSGIWRTPGLTQVTTIISSTIPTETTDSALSIPTFYKPSAHLATFQAILID